MVVAIFGSSAKNAFCYSFCVCVSLICGHKFEYWQQQYGFCAYRICVTFFSDAMFFFCFVLIKHRSQWHEMCLLFGLNFGIVRRNMYILHLTWLSLSVWYVYISHCNLNFYINECIQFPHSLIMFRCFSIHVLFVVHMFGSHRIAFIMMIKKNNLCNCLVNIAGISTSVMSIHMQICFAFSPGFCCCFIWIIIKCAHVCHLQSCNCLDTFNI